MTVEAALATIAVEIEHLAKEISGLKGEQAKRQDKADESRARVHRRLDDVAERVHALEAATRQQGEKLDDVGKVTDEVKRWKVMGMTSLSIVGIGAAAFGITFSDTIKRLLQLLGGRL